MLKVGVGERVQTDYCKFHSVMSWLVKRATGEELFRAVALSNSGSNSKRVSTEYFNSR